MLAASAVPRMGTRGNAVGTFRSAAAPATVSGERSFKGHWAPAREGERPRRTVSQETCRRENELKGPRVEGERIEMATVSNVASQAPSRTHLLSLALAGFLGIFIVGLVGFSQMEVAHNAGHDYRHSMAFPCH